MIGSHIHECLHLILARISPRQVAQRTKHDKRHAVAISHLRHRRALHRSEEHTSELQSLMRISYAVFCLKKTKKIKQNKTQHLHHKDTMKRRVIYRDRDTTQ